MSVDDLIEKYTELTAEKPGVRNHDEVEWAQYNAYTEILEDLKYLC